MSRDSSPEDFDSDFVPSSKSKHDNIF